MKRRAVNKSKSARAFSAGVHKTKLINLVPPPMRGGYRL